jgi:hypothetical protein
MEKSKLKKIMIVIAIIASLGLSEFIGILPNVVARITTSIYVAINYPTNGLKFESAEYAYGFGDYSVRYKDKSGNIQGFMLFPKEFPILIRYDSMKGQN